MKNNNLNQLAREVIKKNQYLALSTVDENGKPWSCILAYTYDPDYNFYFVSLPGSNHSKHIEKLNDIAFSIYDSTQGFGLGVGLQIVGTGEIVNKDKVSEITDIYFGREYPHGNISNDFTVGLRKLLSDGVYNFYKLTPTHVWINDPNADTDRRVEIALK